jgi:hypothetical protein
MAHNTKNRDYKPKLPLAIWIKAFAIGLGALALILFATWQFGSSIAAAKMTGTVVSKEFQPLAEPETQITLSKDKTLRTDKVDGQYIITVEVPQKDGSKKPFTVWLNNKDLYESIKVGDSYDVGPVRVP